MEIQKKLDTIDPEAVVVLGDDDDSGDELSEFDVLAKGNAKKGMGEKADMSREKSGFQVKGTALSFIDKDGDGFISRTEVEEFIVQHHLVKTEKKFFKYGFLLMLCMMIVFSFAIAGLTWGVIVLTKEVTVEDDVMVNADTGEPLQCANTDIVVTNGVLSTRSDVENRRLLDGDDNVLTESTVTALGVRNVYQNRRLSSTMPDAYFKELQWFEIESLSGSFISLKVLATVRIPSSNALCGTYLKLGTIYGTIILDEFDLYFDDETNDVFLQAGLFSYDTAAGLERRQLRSIDHPEMRRLSGNDFSMIGFFNAIDDAEWTCESVRKPSMPSEYSADFVLLSACEEVDDDSPNQCELSIPESIDPIPGYGVVTHDGREYYTRNRKAYVTAESTVLADTYPHMPGMTFLTQSFADPSVDTRTYQFDVEGNLCQCREFEDMDIRMTLPDEYLLYPLGDVGDNLYRYRVSYMGKKDHISDPDEWIHIDYFEDNTTFQAKSLISDNDIVQVDSMLSGDEMESFSSSGFVITDEDFELCKVATSVTQSDRLALYMDGDTVDTNSSDLVEKHLIELEMASWDWQFVPYPPDYVPLAGMVVSTLRYFVPYHVNVTEIEEDEFMFEALDDFGEWLVGIISLETPENIVDFTPVNATGGGSFYTNYSMGNSTNMSFIEEFFQSNSSERRRMSTSYSLLLSSDMVWQAPNAVHVDYEERSPSSRQLTDLQKRQLGMKFSVDPFAPSINIDIKKLSILYEIDLDDIKKHVIEFSGEGCWAGVACITGTIYAEIPLDGPAKTDFGGSVTVKVDVKAFTIEVLKIRYDYTPNNKNYGGYTYQGGTHLAAVERTVSIAKQVKGTAGVEVIHGKKRTKGSSTMYNAGKVSLFIKTHYFKGVGFIGAGSWKHLWSYSYPVTGWGTSSTAAIANCVESAFSLLPELQVFPPHWGLSAGDTYVNMAGDGRFYIKLKIDGKKEVLWSSHESSTSSPEQNSAMWWTWDDEAYFAVIGEGIPFYLSVDISERSTCMYFSGSICVDENSTKLEENDDINSYKDVGHTRMILYGNGNLKIEYTNVKAIYWKKPYFSGWTLKYKKEILFYAPVWKVAWETGVHGSCNK